MTNKQLRKQLRQSTNTSVKQWDSVKGKTFNYTNGEQRLVDINKQRQVYYDRKVLNLCKK